jgi:hypothetical protein
VSLLDIFMPNDLCARCDEREASDAHRLLVENGMERVQLAFCSAECQTAFEVALDAVTRFPIGH